MSLSSWLPERLLLSPEMPEGAGTPAPWQSLVRSCVHISTIRAKKIVSQEWLRYISLATRQSSYTFLHISTGHLPFF